MEEDMEFQQEESPAGDLVSTEGTEPVVQIIMQGESGETLLPSGQLIQVTTEEGQLQYLQVTNENGENQFIQITPDGQAHLVQFTNSEFGTQMTGEDVQASTSAGGDVNVWQVEQLTSEMQTGDNQPEVLQAEVDGDQSMNPGDHQDPEPSVAPDNSADDRSVDQNNDTVANTEEELMTPVESKLLPIAKIEKVTPKKEKAPPPPRKVVPPKRPVTPEPDLSQPIELSSEKIVIIDGKRCLLKTDPDTGQLIAYPVKPDPGKKPRGRPKKTNNGQGSKVNICVDSCEIKEELSDTARDALTEQENSAAEGLLGLSELDGRRKSNRVKKKPRTLEEEYEIGAIEGVDDPDEDDGAKPTPDDKEVIMPSVLLSNTPSTPTPITSSPKLLLPEKRNRGRPPKVPSTANQVQNFLANLGLPVKRGRGRPRRYPASGSHLNQLPAFIIPSANGPAVMMAPLQGINSRNKPVAIVPNTRYTEAASEPPPIIIQNADGTQTHIVAGPPQNTTQATTAADYVPVTDYASSLHQDDPDSNLEADQGLDVTCNVITEPEPSAGEEPQASSLLEQHNLKEEELNTEMDMEMNEVIEETDILPRMSDSETDPINTTTDNKENLTHDHVDNLPDQQTSPNKENTVVSDLPPPTIIQVPENLMPLLFSGRSDIEPVKIGLKQTESDLQKLKCSRCDHQAYYEKQFQDHMATDHADESLKCKCCYFYCFSEEQLVNHFKDSHPKNICTVCNFIAEHAYVIKRHMMRHTAKGCKCHLCGKVYKDRYILKMHVKMVHMPAEILFECSLCRKKFTRKAHLKRHMRIHDPEKPFKCPHCDYRGCERSDITKHVVIHDEPKYPCEVCGKFFRHLKNKELHLKRHKGQRDYKCGMCDFYGYTFTDIRKHIDRKHADAKIVCDKCGCVFRTEALLIEHSQTCSNSTNMISIDPNSYSVLSDDTTAIHIPASQIGPDGQIMVDSNHDYIRVEHQVNVGLGEDGAEVDLTDAQISEASLAESHLVERHISVSNSQAIHPDDLVQAGEIIKIPEGVDISQIIDGATHIQIANTGEFIKVHGRDTDHLSAGIQFVHQDRLSEGVELVEQGEINGDEGLTEGHDLVQEGKIQLVEDGEISEGIPDEGIPDEGIPHGVTMPEGVEFVVTSRPGTDQWSA